jgi:hypothetical protein
LATQIQEWKMKVVSSLSTSWCFTATPIEGYPRGDEFVGRVSPRLGTRRCKGAQGFRQVWANKSVIPYVLCGLYCL